MKKYLENAVELHKADQQVNSDFCRLLCSLTQFLSPFFSTLLRTINSLIIQVWPRKLGRRGPGIASCRHHSRVSRKMNLHDDVILLQLPECICYNLCDVDLCHERKKKSDLKALW